MDQFLHIVDVEDPAAVNLMGIFAAAFFAWQLDRRRRRNKDV